MRVVKLNEKRLEWSQMWRMFGAGHTDFDPNNEASKAWPDRPKIEQTSHSTQDIRILSTSNGGQGTEVEGARQRAIQSGSFYGVSCWCLLILDL